MKAKSVEEKSFYIILWQGKDGIICFGCVKEYVGKKRCWKLRTLIVNVWGVYEQSSPESNVQENMLYKDVSSFQFLLPPFFHLIVFF